jgi:hypothetical protein
MDRELIAETNPELILLEPASMDEAILGIGSNAATGDESVVYSVKKLREVFMRHGMTHDEAQEHIEYNILSTYMGDHTPTFLTVEWGD